MMDSADRLAWSSESSLGGLTAFNNRQQSFDATTRRRKPFVVNYYSTGGYAKMLTADWEGEDK